MKFIGSLSLVASVLGSVVGSLSGISELVHISPGIVLHNEDIISSKSNLFLMLETEPRVVHALGKCSSTELYSLSSKREF